MRASTLFLALVVLTATTACSREAPGSPISPPPASSPGAAARGDRIAPLRISRTVQTTTARRDRSGYTELYLTPKPDDTVLQYLALTPRGSLVAETGTRTGTPGETLNQSTVSIYDGHGLTDFGTSPKEHDRRPRQTIYAATSRSAVVWLETTSTDMFSADWMVYARDLTSRTTHLLGNSSSLSEGKVMPDVPGGSNLTISGGLAAWATARPGHAKPPFESDIVARPVDGSGRLRTLVRHAKMPALRGRTLFYARSNEVDPTMVPDHYEIHRRESDGSDVTVVDAPLDDGQEINFLAASSTRLAWVVGSFKTDKSTLYVRDTKGVTTAFALNHAGASTMDLTLTDSLLAWGNGSASSGDYGDYVYDFRSKQLWRVGGALGYSAAYAAGDYFAWPEMTGPGGTARWWVAKMK